MKKRNKFSASIEVEVDLEELIDDNFDIEDVFQALINANSREEIWEFIKEEFAKEIQEDDEK